MNIGKFTALTHNISYLVCLNEFKVFLVIKCKSVVQLLTVNFLTDNYLPLMSSFTAAALFVFSSYKFPFFIYAFYSL